MNNSATTRMISKIALEYNGNDKGMAIAAASNFLLSSNPEQQYQEMKTVADRNSKVKKWALTLGYNIEEINAFSQKLYKRQSFLLKGLINKQKDVSLLEKASLMIQKALEEKIDKPINYLKNLIQNNQFQVQYRNLENLTIDEIKEIIRDQNLLELLEKLENEDQ